MDKTQVSIDEIYFAAIERDTIEQRAAYLDDVCRSDLELRARVERLLEAKPQVASFLEHPGPGINRTQCEDSVDLSGSQIGPYKLLEVIGEGGMGTVYMAEQTEPVKRRVALKLIKTGMDTKQVIARFEAERQALAMMDHPNIAKVLDAGTTESGRPYFVMELVKGLPITQFCDDQTLPVKDRLKLFQQVCQGVQHAHQKGIIHRDLKPSNVMIAMYDGQPVPKVIDFGVAMATSESLTEQTFFTRFGEVVGTLSYMSPEQAQFNQQDIDTRSDNYSLGAVLYELLVGEPPFDHERMKSQPFDETLRMIREEEPTKPSAKLSSAACTASTASLRATTPEKLNSNIRGDLDWIVMKALEKDRSRRYASGSELALDLQRYLTDEPVSARPPSAVYRFRKFARRNRGALVAASMIAALLVIGTGTSTWFAIQAKTEAKEAKAAAAAAQQQTSIATAIQKFWSFDVIAKASPRDQPNRNITLREVLETASAESTILKHADPVAAAAIHRSIAQTYRGLGDWKKVLEHSRLESSLVEKGLGKNHSHTLRVKALVAFGLARTGRLEEGVRLAEDNLKRCREFLEEDDDLTRQSLGILSSVYSMAGRHTDAIRIQTEVLAWARRKFGNTHESTLRSISNLAALNQNIDELEKAKKLYQTAYQGFSDLYGTAHPDAINCLTAVGVMDLRMGQFSASEHSLQKAIQLSKNVNGIEHRVTLACASGLLHALHELKRIDHFVEIQELFLQGMIANLERALPSTVLSQEYGGTGASLKRTIEFFEDLIEILEEDLNEDPTAQKRQMVLTCYEIYAMDLEHIGEIDRAAIGWQRVIGARENWVDHEPSKLYNLIMLGDAISKRGICLYSLEDYDGAIKEFEKAELLLKQACDVTSDYVLARHRLEKNLIGLAKALRAKERYGEANAKWNELIALAGKNDVRLFAIQKCETTARSGQHRLASETVDGMIENELVNQEHWPNIASVYSWCAHAVLNDDALPRDDRADASLRYQEQATKALNHVRDDLSEEQLDYIATSKSFGPLRERDDFISLIERWNRTQGLESQTSVSQDRDSAMRNEEQPRIDDSKREQEKD